MEDSENVNIVNAAYPLADDVLRSVPPEGTSLAIGDFDGVHVGHRAVLKRAVETARRRGMQAAVMTFSPHPREVLGSPAYSDWITPLPRKLALISETGMDTAYVFAFDAAFAALSPDEFVERVLKPLRVRAVSVGFNFTFGRKGAGTAAMLRELGEGLFTVDIVEPMLVNGERVSSTSIREALREGDVERAAALLGRPFSVTGYVVAGEGRGRTIGIPTANLAIPERCVKPAGGVYAVTARIETGPYAGRTFGGVMNVGVKPTFHAALPEPSWEAHLFDFDGDLYGQRITVSFRFRLREERKFASARELVERIREDIAEARRMLAERV